MNSVDLNDLKNKKIALVLSGGVVKAAAWHLGVTHALEELGFYLKSNKNSSPSQSLNQRSLEIGTYVGSSAGAMICVYLASGYTPQDIIQATLGIKGSKIRGITYKDMFTIRRPELKAPKSGLYHPLEGFPVFLKNLIKPVVSLPGFFSTEGVRNYLLENIRENDTFESLLPTCSLLLLSWIIQEKLFSQNIIIQIQAMTQLLLITQEQMSLTLPLLA